jgi:lysylphosphatidylglycerol synthetase-like protein (DUF2156 family)
MVSHRAGRRQTAADRTPSPGVSDLSLPPPAAAAPESHAGSWSRGRAGIERAREFLTQHLARFYDFEGLFRFKRKFDPQFEPRYLIYPSPFALPQVTLALIRAQTPGA